MLEGIQTEFPGQFQQLSEAGIQKSLAEIDLLRGLGVGPDQSGVALVEIVFRLPRYCREGFFPEMEIATDHVNQTQELR
jgi:hypothetical protein